MSDKQSIEGPVVVVHGGAGLFPPDLLPECLAGCERAALAGASAIEKGALDAAVAAVRVLEDIPVTNAGYGSTLTSAGTVELEAAVMTGVLEFGAVAACPPVESAIELARRVLQGGEHSLYAGTGALDFARSAGMKVFGSEDLIVERVRKRWEQVRAAGADSMESASRIVREMIAGGTVGAVALDAQGSLAAATSTGGRLFKRPGRVGDTPLPGAGTYADAEAGGAASATGEGEAILRVLLCRLAVEGLRGHAAPQQAGMAAIETLERRTGGKAGLILVDSRGRIFAGRNTPSMPWAWCRPGGSPVSDS